MKKRLLHNNNMTPEQVKSYALELLPIQDKNTLMSILNSMENAFILHTLQNYLIGKKQ